MRRWIVAASLVVALAGVQSRAGGCKFCCGHKVPTMRQDAAEAKVVLYGTLGNPRVGRDGRNNPTPEGVEGTTDFTIERSIRTDPVHGGEKLIELQRVVAINPGSKRFLIFFDVTKGKLDPYKGFDATPAVVDYLNGILALDQKNTRQVLAYAFRHLEHPDNAIAEDAWREFEAVEYKDYRDLAATLLPDELARWLADPKVSLIRKGLYALLLGHCGREQDAAVLRRLLDDPTVRQSGGILDRILTGYTLLRPREGWALLDSCLKDRTREFLERYSALRAARFFWESRPGVVAPKDLKEGLHRLLDQDDIADLYIDDLRRWSQWDASARVLALRRKEAIWKIPFMRRSILRYALCCPGEDAARFVREMRKENEEWVRETEEILQLEKEQAAKAQPIDS